MREPSPGAFLDTPFPGLCSSVCEAWLCGGACASGSSSLLSSHLQPFLAACEGRPSLSVLASAHTLEAERPGRGPKQHGRVEYFSSN